MGVLLGPVAATVPSCSLPNTTMATLFSLDAHDPHFLAVASTSASDCCQICAEKSTCNTWSYTAAKWTPATPCHLSAFSPIAIEPVPGSPYAGGCRSGHCVVVPAPPTPPPPPPPTPPAGPIAPGVFQVQLNATRQIILGIGQVSGQCYHLLRGVRWVRRVRRGRALHYAQLQVARCTQYT